MTVLAWAWYGLAVAALLGLAALACDTIARITAHATRWVWLTSIAASIALPLAALLPRAGASVPNPPVPLIGAIPLPPHLGRWFLIAWALVSGVLLLRLARGLRGARRTMRGWSANMVQGVPVLIARDTGPAVVGALHPVIVLPEWALTLPRSQRALVVLHEIEHRRAGDQWVELMASVTYALLPWNVALWYQIDRLRLAMELDCDARVLRRRPGVARYARLLVDSAGIHRGRTYAASLPLDGPALALAHRIRAMTAPRPTRRIGIARVTASAVAALLAVGAATRVRRPPSVQWMTAEPPAATPVSLPQLDEDRIVAIDADGIVKQVSGPPLREVDAAALRHVRGPALVRFTPDPDRPTQTVAIVTYRQGV